jgi:putative ABC transport system permease protein
MKVGRAWDERVYERLLRLLPASFRAEAAAELVDMYRGGRRRARSHGRLALVAFWFRMTVDLGVTVAMERRESSGVARRRGRNVVRLDLVPALREMGRRPAAALTASATLGLGIAATVVLGVLVRDVLLKPLPFSEADRLVRVTELEDGGGSYWPSFPNIRDWRDRAEFLEGVIAADVGAVRPVISDGQAVRATLGRVSRGFFGTLGVRPVMGRDLRDDENAPGGAAVALVSEEFWRGRLLGRRLDGLTLELDAMASAGISTGAAEVFEVVGVVPAGFRFLGYGNEWVKADVWLPLERSANLGSRTTHGFHTIARLRPGQTVAQAATAMDQLAARLKAEHGEPTQADRILVQPLSDAVIGRARAPLQALLLAGLFVLLVACLNLGAGLLARGLARRRELAVRSALGATRGDLIRSQLVRAATLAVPGAAFGLGLAWLALHIIRTVVPGAVPRLDAVALDPMAAVGAVGLALLTAVIAGTLPALALSLRDVSQRLRTHGGTDTHGQRMLWTGFVAGQVALTLALLVTCGLLLRSLANAMAVDVGYDADGVMMADVALPPSYFGDPSRRAIFFEAVLDRLRQDPAIAAVGLTSVPPHELTARIGGTGREGDTERRVFAGLRLVDAGFFDVLRIPVDRGSLDATRDAVIIDRSLVERLWQGDVPDGDVVNTYGGVSGIVAGVSGSLRAWDQPQAPGAVYMHFSRRPSDLLEMHILARGDDPGRVVQAIRAAMAEADPLVPYDVESLERLVAASMAGRRLTVLIAIAFAAVTLVLSAAGVHAMVAQVQARRARETGIRLMLGAPPASVGRGIAGFGMRATIAGIALGIPLVVIATRAVRSQLFGVAPLDPISLAAPAALLLVAAALATAVPARRAARTDPLALMRGES